MADIFEKAEQVLAEIAAQSPANAAELEQFRIQYLGTKGLIKGLMEEMRNVPNERKRDYGQLMNRLKQEAETKHDELKESFESQSQGAAAQAIDLTAPGEPLPLGSRHPVAVTMNRIVDIFTRMGFSVVDGPEIEDDWHNFTAMNTPEDHPPEICRTRFMWWMRPECCCAPTLRLYRPGSWKNGSRPSALLPLVGCTGMKRSLHAHTLSFTR